MIILNLDWPLLNIKKKNTFYYKKLFIYSQENQILGS